MYDSGMLRVDIFLQYFLHFLFKVQETIHIYGKNAWKADDKANKG